MGNGNSFILDWQLTESRAQSTLHNLNDSLSEVRVLSEGMSGPGPHQGPSGHNPIYSFLEISTNEPILAGKVVSSVNSGMYSSESRAATVHCSYFLRSRQRTIELMQCVCRSSLST